MPNARRPLTPTISNYTPRGSVSEEAHRLPSPTVYHAVAVRDSLLSVTCTIIIFPATFVNLMLVLALRIHLVPYVFWTVFPPECMSGLERTMD